ncbi:serine/threonine protein kinase [Comamonas sediminis]|uniref:serine/threonine protein kinase n=1 Tax=Comamonas sediminis TaxID=1783360 RepID=UPI003D267648
MRTPPQTPAPDDDNPGIDRSEDAAADLPEGDDINDHLSAEDDVADSIEDVSAHRFDDMPQDGPLNFDDGTDMGHPRGNTAREGGTWNAEGGDSGQISPPAEVLSNRNGPSAPKDGS